MYRQSRDLNSIHSSKTILTLFSQPKSYYNAVHISIHQRTYLATGLLRNSAFAVRIALDIEAPIYDLHELVYTVDPDGRCKLSLATNMYLNKKVRYQNLHWKKIHITWLHAFGNFHQKFLYHAVNIQRF